MWGGRLRGRQGEGGGGGREEEQIQHRESESEREGESMCVVRNAFVVTMHTNDMIICLYSTYGLTIC